MKKLTKGCKVAQKLQRLQPAKLNTVLHLRHKVARLHAIYKNKVNTSLYIGKLILELKRLSCAASKFLQPCNLYCLSSGYVFF